MLSFPELVFIAISLSMDAFAIALCMGVSASGLQKRYALVAGVYFGGFQALMPLAGYFLGVRFQNMIESVDHWAAFTVLFFLGVRMMRNAYKEKDAADQQKNAALMFSFAQMLPLAAASSADALAVGITFAFLKVRIVLAVCVIGCVTFFLSAAGVLFGRVFGARFRQYAEFAGGAALIITGTKILLEHSGVLSVF